MKKINPDTFEYTKLIKGKIKELRLKQNKNYYKDIKHRYKQKTNNEDVSARMIRQKATIAVNEEIKNMESSDYKKMLILERQYIRQIEKDKLKKEIEKSDIGEAGGDYTLFEIGKVLGVSRERIRQIEDSALKVLRKPENARIMRMYLDDFGLKEIQQN